MQNNAKISDINFFLITLIYYLSNWIAIKSLNIKTVFFERMSSVKWKLKNYFKFQFKSDRFTKQFFAIDGGVNLR